MPASGNETSDMSKLNMNASKIDQWAAGVNSALGGSTANFADAEVPAVAGDGVTCTLAHAPNPPASLILVVNGIVFRNGVDYTLTSNVAVLNVAPSDAPVAWYRY